MKICSKVTSSKRIDFSFRPESLPLGLLRNRPSQGPHLSKVSRLFCVKTVNIFCVKKVDILIINFRNYFAFSYLKKHIKRTAFQNKGMAISQMAFRARKFSGLSRNGPQNRYRDFPQTGPWLENFSLPLCGSSVRGLALDFLRILKL